MTKTAAAGIKIAAAVASGLLVAVLFPPFDVSWLVWISLMPLLAALGCVDGKRKGLKGFLLAYFGGLVSCLIQFNWFATVSWLGALLMPIYLAVYWGLFGWFATTLGQPRGNAGFLSHLRAAFCLAAAWAGQEWLRGWVITGFGWNGLGMAFSRNHLMSQGADLLGATGLSLALVFFQALLVFGIRFAIRRKSIPCREIGVAAALIGAMAIYGKIRIGAEYRAQTVPLKALLVQNNIPQDAATQLWDALTVHQAYEDETLKGLQDLKPSDPTWPDWVLWPEVALTGRVLYTADGEMAQWDTNVESINQVRTAGPFTLIYGVNELEAERVGDQFVPKTRGRAYNSIAVLTPEDELQTYRKHHLVIFGETIPFVDTIPLLRTIYEQQSGSEYHGSFTAGDSLEPLPMHAGSAPITAIPTVCFEDTVPRLVRKFVRPGPQLIVNVTNDGWFKESAAAAQHFADARFRAIELRRPMLRCANSGVSAAIDSTGSTRGPDGKLQELRDASGSHFTRGSLLTTLNIPLHPSFSLYAIIGDWGILGLTALAFAMAVFGPKIASSPTDS